jgi:signal transduction histidine kinase/PAS domain-containing protein
VSIDLDYQRIFESAPTALLVLDPDLTIVDVNDAYLAMIGTDAATLLGRNVFDVFPDGPGEGSGALTLRTSLERVRAHLVPDIMPILKYALAVPGQDGAFATRYWAPVNAPVLDANGDLAWIVNRAEELTEYVQERIGDVAQEHLAAELGPTVQPEREVHSRQRLQEQNQTLLAVLNSLDTAVVGCDRHGNAVMTNRAARALFELPEHHAPIPGWGQRYSNFVCSDAEGNVIAADDLPTQLLLRGKPVHNMVIVAKAEGAPPRTLVVHGQTVTGGGRLASVIAVHEITRRRRAEQLKECEKQVTELLAKPEPADNVLGNAVELIGSMLGWTATEFWAVDQVGQVLRRTAGWVSPDHGGDLASTTLPDRVEEGFGIPGKAWSDREPVWVTDLDSDAAAAQQSTDWLPLRAALAVPLPSGALVLGVLVCYSDNHEVPDDMRTAVTTGIAAHIGEFLERRRAEQFAAELETTRAEYIALVGHELRTPLTSIQSCTEMMRSEPDMPAEERGQMLDVMHRRAADLHALIGKLLDVAGTRSGHIVLQTRPMDLADVARASGENARTSRPAVTVDVNTPPRAVIDGDPDRLREVVDELVRNALTWAPDHSTVGITVHADERTAVLAVTNTGTPLPPDERLHIFDLFYRTRATVHRGIPGAGLGLTLARAVVERHGGSVSVSEPEEAATTFTVRLPTDRTRGRRAAAARVVPS